ncbi:unnamed protein product [Larinioides sclopetarius]|uniref:Uncharacterized protein n=1 Tax=Larinioides sclopetarius TaxID=280406 RepID=A0AAV1ZSW3_9ARAC
MDPNSEPFSIFELKVNRTLLFIQNKVKVDLRTKDRQISSLSADISALHNQETSELKKERNFDIKVTLQDYKERVVQDLNDFSMQLIFNFTPSQLFSMHELKIYNILEDIDRKCKEDKRNASAATSSLSREVKSLKNKNAFLEKRSTCVKKYFSAEKDQSCILKEMIIQKDSELNEIVENKKSLMPEIVAYEKLMDEDTRYLVSKSQKKKIL